MIANDMAVDFIIEISTNILIKNLHFVVILHRNRMQKKKKMLTMMKLQLMMVMMEKVQIMTIS